MLPGIVADAGDDEAAAAVAVDFLGREVSAAENGRRTVDGGGEDVLRAIADAEESLSFTRQKFVVVSAVTLTYWSFVIRPVTFTLPMVAFFSP